MKFTNKFNLPPRVIQLLPKMYQPKPGRFGVTALIDSPAKRTLLLEKWDDIEIDHSDSLPVLIGVALHDRQARLEDTDEHEHKLEDEVDAVTVAGKADTYDGVNHTIRDTKCVAIGFEKFGLAELTKQLNVYAWQRRRREQSVERVEGDIYYRDWKLKYALYDLDYPQILFRNIRVDLWPFEQQDEFVKDLIHFHIMEPMSCPMEMRWPAETTWAVKKIGNPKALRVLSSKEEAEKWMQEKKRGDSVEERKGECLRCEHYCIVRSVCPLKGKI